MAERLFSGDSITLKSGRVVRHPAPDVYAMGALRLGGDVLAVFNSKECDGDILGELEEDSKECDGDILGGLEEDNIRDDVSYFFEAAGIDSELDSGSDSDLD